MYAYPLFMKLRSLSHIQQTSPVSSRRSFTRQNESSDEPRYYGDVVATNLPLAQEQQPRPQRPFNDDDSHAATDLEDCEEIWAEDVQHYQAERERRSRALEQSFSTMLVKTCPMSRTSGMDAEHHAQGTSKAQTQVNQGRILVTTGRQCLLV